MEIMVTLSLSINLKCVCSVLVIWVGHNLQPNIALTFFIMFVKSLQKGTIDERADRKTTVQIKNNNSV